MSVEGLQAMSLSQTHLSMDFFSQDKFKWLPGPILGWGDWGA